MASPKRRESSSSVLPFPKSQKIADVGQWRLLEKILPYTTSTSSGTLASKDDVMHLPGVQDSQGRQLFVNTDSFVQSTDMPQAMSPYDAGWKAVTAAVSDLGAKGVQPAGLVVSICFARSMLANDALRVVEGIAQACKRYGCGYYGGDLNEGPEIIITPTVMGLANPLKVPGRGGAKPGDIICVSSELGRTAAGLEVILLGKTCPPQVMQNLLQAVFHPETPLEQGIAMADEGLPNAAMDSSDGIAFSIGQLAAESRCGAEIWKERLPIAPEVIEFAPNVDRQVKLAFYGGEEYCYLWTIPECNVQRATTLCQAHHWGFFEIGKVTQDPAIILKSKGRPSVPLETRGFSHFAEE